MNEPVKRYKVFLNGTAFMGMMKRRDDGVYGPEYAPDSFTDFCIFSDHERARAEDAAEIAALIKAAIKWRDTWGLPLKRCRCAACKLNRAVRRVVKERRTL